MHVEQRADIQAGCGPRAMCRARELRSGLLASPWSPARPGEARRGCVTCGRPTWLAAWSGRAGLYRRAAPQHAWQHVGEWRCAAGPGSWSRGYCREVGGALWHVSIGFESPNDVSKRRRTLPGMHVGWLPSLERSLHSVFETRTYVYEVSPFRQASSIALTLPRGRGQLRALGARIALTMMTTMVTVPRFHVQQFMQPCARISSRPRKGCRSRCAGAFDCKSLRSSRRYPGEPVHRFRSVFVRFTRPSGSCRSFPSARCPRRWHGGSSRLSPQMSRLTPDRPDWRTGYPDPNAGLDPAGACAASKQYARPLRPGRPASAQTSTNRGFAGWTSPKFPPGTASRRRWR
ncbi:hypothetical protein LMG23994_04526 [Cupriavidus pinatubonensis]|uniref:Uncharacterized protein n=1 Tax=Cupriavidus pinatubonensis TaxID=248026 RepID=A0ABN7Z4U3_9BURK|nr:hypothetical protein LMG23994_04526 [Cupriavidus pinatubonensis]